MVDQPGDDSELPGSPPLSSPPPPVYWEPPGSSGRSEVAPGLVFASTPRRFVAYVIDSLVIGVVAYLLSLAVTEATRSRPDSLVATWSSTIAYLVISLVYFAWGWRTRSRATPGMRLLKLQLGNASDGRIISLEQAFRRWFGLGEAFSLLYLIPELVFAASILSVAYLIVLLFTTISSPTKQGLHDRFANTAVVEPAGLGSSGLVVGCIAMAVILLILPLVALVFLGAQLSDMLSAVGSPAP
ncbi:MAG: RDD family protein [Chloroflexota bacterium]|nr:RDD family protein [Chloroflexota bacterium]